SFRFEPRAHRDLTVAGTLAAQRTLEDRHARTGPHCYRALHDSGAGDRRRPGRGGAAPADRAATTAAPIRHRAFAAARGPAGAAGSAAGTAGARARPGAGTRRGCGATSELDAFGG